MLRLVCGLLLMRKCIYRALKKTQKENCTNLSVKDIVQLDIVLEIQGLQCNRKKIIDACHFNSDPNMPLQYLDSIIVHENEKPIITCCKTDTERHAKRTLGSDRFSCPENANLPE